MYPETPKRDTLLNYIPPSRSKGVYEFALEVSHLEKIQILQRPDLLTSQVVGFSNTGNGKGKAAPLQA